MRWFDVRQDFVWQAVMSLALKQSSSGWTHDNPEISLVYQVLEVHAFHVSLPIAVERLEVARIYDLVHISPLQAHHQSGSPGQSNTVRGFLLQDGGPSRQLASARSLPFESHPNP